MEPVRDYELRAFFSHVIGVLESLGIPYMVVGGFAAIFYGEPRLTIDVDLLVDMQPDRVPSFVAAFPVPDYYVSEDGIRDALRRNYPFNVIEPCTGAKVDLVPLPADPFTQAAFQRRQRLPYNEAGQTAVFITAEDIVVAKLVAHQATGSDKHLRDARGVLLTQGDDLDLVALRRRAQGSLVRELLEALLQDLERDTLE